MNGFYIGVRAAFFQKRVPAPYFRAGKKKKKKMAVQESKKKTKSGKFFLYATHIDNMVCPLKIIFRRTISIDYRP